MTPRQKLEIRQSERRQRLNELAGLDGLTDEQRTELDTLTADYADGERQYRAAVIADADAASAAAAAGDPTGGEDPARLELRSRCRVGNFLTARLQNRSVTGAEAELAAEVGTEGGIPLELWEPTPEQRAADLERRAVTAAPGTVGLNLDLIRPAVFAPSVLPRLGVEMPRVGTGTYASATITGNTAAEAVGKGTDAPATAASFTVTSATPKRVSARLELAIEDIAAVGQDNFEAALRQNLSLALSSELDDQGLNGNGTAPNLKGLIAAIGSAPTAPTAVADFDAFVATYAEGVEGLWATMCSQVGVVVGVDTYRLAAQAFRDTPSDGGDGAEAFTEYAARNYGGLWTSDRMPDTASNVQQAILYRQGRSLMGGSEGIRTAVCPVWSEIGIDDPYTGSVKGQRYVTFHVLLGDVIVVQSGAYKRVAFKVS